MAMVADVSRCWRLGDRPDAGLMDDTIARGGGGTQRVALPFPRWRGSITGRSRPLTTEVRVATLEEGRAALERGRPVVLVTPPAPEQAGDVWELVPPGDAPGVGPPVVVRCANETSALEWAAAAPTGRRVHAVTALARTA